VNRILETAVIQEWMVRTLSQQYLPYIGYKICWFCIAIRVECHYWCCLW